MVFTVGFFISIWLFKSLTSLQILKIKTSCLKKKEKKWHNYAKSNEKLHVVRFLFSFCKRWENFSPKMWPHGKTFTLFQKFYFLMLQFQSEPRFVVFFSSVPEQTKKVSKTWKEKQIQLWWILAVFVFLCKRCFEFWIKTIY